MFAEMLDGLTYQVLAGQVLGLVALGLCILAFASRDDDRLLFILVGANVAFALHFVLFGAWTAAALTGLIILRIMLARRYRGSLALATLMLAASGVAAALTWRAPIDALPLVATVLGTIAMFLLRGIPMRVLLALAAFTWTLNNLLIGSIGGAVAEALILATNLVTIARLMRARTTHPAAGA